MKADAKKLARTAQQAIVEVKPSSGSPPSYPSRWRIIWSAKVDFIEINAGSKPNKAVIWFPSLHYHQPCPLKAGDMVRICTAELRPADRSVIFTGFVTADVVEFSGSSNNSSGYERNAVVAQDHRWVLNKTNVIFGQVTRGPDDYSDYGTAQQEPIDDSYIFLSGQRAIFNANGLPNCDATELRLADPLNSKTRYTIPIFSPPHKTETSTVKFWTARKMVRYLLSPLFNRSFIVFPWLDAAVFYGLDEDDWDKVLHHVVIDGLSSIEALELVCHQLGWSYRIADVIHGVSPWFDFYRLGRANGYRRTENQPTILHHLYSPLPGENIKAAVARGEKMLWSGMFQKDITPLVNEPLGLGSPHRFEFTAELVPAWPDADFTLEIGDNIFLTQAQIQKLENPDAVNYFKHYHVQGSEFLRQVARKWALNEAGDYSGEGYSRGKPFEFESVIPEQYLTESTTGFNRGRLVKKIKRLYAPFRRQLLNCLTLDKESLNSIGLHVQFSFDWGESWHVVPARISSLGDEAGIYIEEENLAEMLDPQLRTISGGPLDGVELNYYTSLADDRINARNFGDGHWRTRVRITASIQMDNRLVVVSNRQPSSGSPFIQRAVYDFSGKYGIAQRTQSSLFSSGAEARVDSTDTLQTHLDAIRNASQDISICGHFTLDRLWLNDGFGEPVFMPGDCVEKLTGRNYSLAANFAGKPIYPEIAQVVYMLDQQITKIITRDLRFAEVRLI